jgi:hypothetical protein
VCGKCQSSRGTLECVYEDLGLVSFEGLNVPAEEVTAVPPSPTVLEFLNHSASMELNVADFENPFSFDAATLSADDLHLRLYVSYRSLTPPFGSRRLVPSRIIFISYRYKVGMCGLFSKQQAIILGDKSGTFVHPFYIDFAHLFGCITYQRMSPNRSFQNLEAGFFTMVLESLASLKESEDAFTYAQAHWFMAYGYLTQLRYPLAEKYLESCVRAVEGNPGAFLPHLVRAEAPEDDEVSEQSQDRMAFLASLISYRTLLRIRAQDAKSGVPPEEAMSWLAVGFSVLP